MDNLTERVFAGLSEFGSDPSWSEMEGLANELGAKFANGETRWAFVFTKQRIVYKFPRFDNVEDDYCAIECQNYEKAKRFGVEKICLPIELMGTTENGLPVYRQPMYTTSYADMRNVIPMLRRMNVSDETVAKVQHGCFQCWKIQETWLARAIQIYGKKFMRSFEEWTYEAKVNDLHGENTGFLGKMPIIIDYAGYHG